MGGLYFMWELGMGCLEPAYTYILLVKRFPNVFSMFIPEFSLFIQTVCIFNDKAVGQISWKHRKTGLIYIWDLLVHLRHYSSLRLHLDISLKVCHPSCYDQLWLKWIRSWKGSAQVWSELPLAMSSRPETVPIMWQDIWLAENKGKQTFKAKY